MVLIYCATQNNSFWFFFFLNMIIIIIWTNYSYFLFIHTTLSVFLLTSRLCLCVFTESKLWHKKSEKEGPCVLSWLPPLGNPHCGTTLKINTQMMFSNCGRLDAELKQYQWGKGNESWMALFTVVSCSHITSKFQHKHPLRACKSRNY